MTGSVIHFNLSSTKTAEAAPWRSPTHCLLAEMFCFHGFRYFSCCQKYLQDSQGCSCLVSQMIERDCYYTGIWFLKCIHFLMFAYWMRQRSHMVQFECVFVCFTNCMCSHLSGLCTVSGTLTQKAHGIQEVHRLSQSLWELICTNAFSSSQITLNLQLGSSPVCRTEIWCLWEMQIWWMMILMFDWKGKQTAVSICFDIVVYMLMEFWIFRHMWDSN